MISLFYVVRNKGSEVGCLAGGLFWLFCFGFYLIVWFVLFAVHSLLLELLGVDLGTWGEVYAAVINVY